MEYEDDADPFVPVWEGPYVEAEHLRLRIEEAHIPVNFGDALLTGHARVQVPRSYLAEVQDVIAGVQASWPRVTTETADGFDWKPGIRLALIVVAAIVLFFFIVVYALQ
jgi:hypothetical protein